MKRHLAGLLAVLMLFSMMSVMAVQAEEAEGNPNLITNGDFEKLADNGLPEGWEFSDEQHMSVESKNVCAGENSMKVSTTTGGAPWIRTRVYDPVPGAVYEVSAMTNVELTAPGMSEGLVIKMEVYNGHEMEETTFTDHFSSDFWPDSTNNLWIRRSGLFTLPADVKMVAIYLRYYCNGTALYDNVEMKLAGDPKKYSMEVGDVFHYPYEEKGTATVSLSSFFTGKPVADETRVDFELRDGDKVLDKQYDVPLHNLDAVYTYDISLLKEKKKAYTIHATAKWEDEEESFRQNVYVFDRPSMIGDDGRIYIEGEVFNPIMACAVAEYTWDKLEGSGVNVVFWGSAAKNEKGLQVIDEYLDTISKSNMKTMFILYHNMKPAGHPNNEESTKFVVEHFKDDPRIFAWAVMDEPFSHSDTPEMREWMENSYKIIREIDDMHPVHIIDMSSMGPKYSDIYTNDAYAKEDNRSVSMNLNEVNQEIDSDYYFQYLVDVYKWNGVMQTEKGLRSSAYRAFEEGIKGFGYYAIRNAIGHDASDPMIPLYEYEPLWGPFCRFNTVEAPILFDIFVNGKYEQFNAYYDKSNVPEGDYWSTWTDGKVVYMIVHNKSTQKKTIEVPLASANGLVSIGKHKIEQIGGPEVTPTGKDSLSFELDDQSVVLFKLTPSHPINLKKLNESAFSDLAGYDWAEKEINALYAKNIVNAIGDKLYGPGQNITRADFAMFLIRTLGLTSDSTELFADVPADAYYAKELAAGKALGILKGVDAANYNPNAEISRQDMMTICYRGLTHVGKNKTSDNAILEKFLDKASIADYAAEAVRDMAGMEIVKGDPSGNVNPLGNTTRAEAAVIMNRILGL